MLVLKGLRGRLGWYLGASDGSGYIVFSIAKWEAVKSTCWSYMWWTWTRKIKKGSRPVRPVSMSCNSLVTILCILLMTS